MSAFYPVMLTPSQRMALLTLVTESMSDGKSPEVYIDVTNNVETTPSQLIQLLMEAPLMETQPGGSALLTFEPTAKEAFTAGYHCRWHKERGVYSFDPQMAPGDPDGAFRAWLQSHE